jgi:selenocysteine lyase/cysteine desulfurase
MPETEPMSSFKAYFNYAGLSRPLPAVLDQMRSAEREYRSHIFSEHGIRMYFDMLAERRKAVAAVLGVDGPKRVSLLTNATTALQITLGTIGAALNPGDVVVTSDQEHPCVIRPLNLLARRGIEIVQIKPDRNPNSSAASKYGCGGDARLVLLSRMCRTRMAAFCQCVQSARCSPRAKSHIS